MTSNSQYIKIPHNELSAEALNGVIGLYISRDGQDSGHVDTTYEGKVEQVKNMLNTGQAILFFDSETQSCNIVSKNEALLLDL